VGKNRSTGRIEVANIRNQRQATKKKKEPEKGGLSHAHLGSEPHKHASPKELRKKTSSPRSGKSLKVQVPGKQKPDLRQVINNSTRHLIIWSANRGPDAREAKRGQGE